MESSRCEKVYKARGREAMLLKWGMEESSSLAEMEICGYIEDLICNPCRYIHRGPELLPCFFFFHKVSSSHPLCSHLVLFLMLRSHRI